MFAVYADGFADMIEIVVKGLSEQNKEVTLLLYGMEAIAVQHEIDHLYGKTIMDYQKEC